MSRQIMPQFDNLDQSADYARWLHYADQGKWEGEQERQCDLTALPRLFPHLQPHGSKRSAGRLGACKRCEFVENAVE